MLGHALALAPQSPVFKSVQIAVIFLAAGISIVGFTENAPIITLRYAALAAFAVQIWMEIAGREYVFLKSPVFLLGLAAGFGFSLLPSLGYFITQLGYVPSFNLETFLTMYQKPDLLGYFGHRAEFYVISFSAAALFVYATVRYFTTSPAAPSPLPLSAKTENVLASAAVALTAISMFGVLSGMLPPTVSALLSNAYPPLQSLLLMVLLHQYMTKNAGGLRLVSLTVIAIAFYIAAHHAKAPLYLVTSMAFYYAYVRKPALLSILKFGAVFIVFIFFLAQIAQVLRTEYSSVTRFGGLDLNMAVDVFASKAIWRQVDTGYCLSNVIDKHKTIDAADSDHLFWIRALVPRVIWPEKESLSLGGMYSLAYCGGVIELTHSASITLLGQPIIKAGIAGMVIHTGILLIALGALTWTALRYPGLGAVSIMALLPWWIDFDQDFALYVANLVKFFLLMCPIILLLFLLGRLNVPANSRAKDTTSRTAD